MLRQPWVAISHTLAQKSMFFYCMMTIRSPESAGYKLSPSPGPVGQGFCLHCWLWDLRHRPGGLPSFEAANLWKGGVLRGSTSNLKKNKVVFLVSTMKHNVNLCLQIQHKFGQSSSVIGPQILLSLAVSPSICARRQVLLSSRPLRVRDGRWGFLEGKKGRKDW